jgi:hypothetical protein
MRVLNAVQRVLLLLVLVPVLAICLDTLLRAFGAQRSNPIVSGVRNFANIFLIEPFKTVFPDQNYWQNAAVALAAFGILALVIVFIFRGLRAMAASRPPSVRTTPAPAASQPAPKAAPPSPPPTSDTTTAPATAGDDTKSPSA